MQIRSFFLILAIASVTGFGAGAATLDANHTTTDKPNNNTGLGFVTTSLGQTFTAIGSGILQSVQFSILKFGASTSDVGFDIRNLDGSAPDPDAADALFSSSIANGDIGVLSGNPYSWTMITVDVSSANIAVTSGDTLSFFLSSIIGQSFAVQTDYQNAYSGGQRWSQNGDGNAFSANTAADLTFATTIAAVPLPASLPLLLLGIGGLSWIRRRRESV